MLKFIKKSLNNIYCRSRMFGYCDQVKHNTILTSFKSVSLSNSLSRGAILHFDGFNATTALIVLESYQTHLRSRREAFFAA